MATDIDRLKKLRETRGLTQRELADLLGITDQTVSNVERGQRPSLDVGLKFARFYGVPAEDLFAPSVPTQDVAADAEDRGAASLVAPSSPSVTGEPTDRMPGERSAAKESNGDLAGAR